MVTKESVIAQYRALAPAGLSSVIVPASLFTIDHNQALDMLNGMAQRIADLENDSVMKGQLRVMTEQRDLLRSRLDVATDWLADKGVAIDHPEMIRILDALRATAS